MAEMSSPTFSGLTPFSASQPHQVVVAVGGGNCGSGGGSWGYLPYTVIQGPGFLPPCGSSLLYVPGIVSVQSLDDEIQ